MKNCQCPIKFSACGKPEIQGQRVIAGVTATRGSWPWQILMLYNGRGGCGGSIVGPRHVVTAAHCVAGRTRYPTRFSVRYECTCNCCLIFYLPY